jgi:chromatin segregation and condensation protein Rec8/ScpA/Scc1 (kleisin family)
MAAYRVPITVHLDSFEGPLDLLLYLIQSHELDINKVSISKITDQYLAYVRLMQELNFDTASEFLVLAATLLLWKSKSLLPNDEKNDAGASAEGDEFTQEELIRQLLEHQRFLAAGESLAHLDAGDALAAVPHRHDHLRHVEPRRETGRAAARGGEVEMQRRSAAGEVARGARVVAWARAPGRCLGRRLAPLAWGGAHGGES